MPLEGEVNVAGVWNWVEGEGVEVGFTEEVGEEEVGCPAGTEGGEEGRGVKGEGRKEGGIVSRVH